MEEFLGVFLGGRCHASYDLCIKLVAEGAEYLSLVVKEHATLCKLVTDFLHEMKAIASLTNQKNMHVIQQE
ncbi:putative transposable element encoded protein [Trachipleistophora hominis]|uniref:Putative transposable element encoded protein n=1 Tax=Trachipleistophora hominis TaxID=72359 RepID=L7JUR6_TRAHO|nr:putative transposable element encoded protein [Trachipleistophora hominis]